MKKSILLIILFSLNCPQPDPDDNIKVNLINNLNQGIVYIIKYTDYQSKNFIFKDTNKMFSLYEINCDLSLEIESILVHDRNLKILLNYTGSYILEKYRTSKCVYDIILI